MSPLCTDHTIDAIWLTFAFLHSRCAVLWLEMIRSAFQCGPHKSELDATLSEKQMHFLAPTPCCCIPGQPQKTPPLFNHRAAARNHPFRELLRSCLPSRSPVTFLVYSGLPRGRTWAQWRKKPSPWVLPSSTAQAGSGAHCQKTGWLLLSEISILFVSSG